VARAAKGNAVMAEGKIITVPATSYQRNIGLYQDQVVNGHYAAVIVAPHGRPAVAIISAAEYDDLMAARRELKRMRQGMLDSKEPFAANG
jgi:prevent-host-death family protein